MLIKDLSNFAIAKFSLFLGTVRFIINPLDIVTPEV